MKPFYTSPSLLTSDEVTDLVVGQRIIMAARGGDFFDVT